MSQLHITKYLQQQFLNFWFVLNELPASEDSEGGSTIFGTGLESASCRLPSRPSTTAASSTRFPRTTCAPLRALRSLRESSRGSFHFIRKTVSKLPRPLP
ncbi:hypothetical protein WDL1P1_00576 (plasmid) [Variovorax sp. WDL1]|nr:hypothetical protein WDL1P1_00576 [Variovorax sp. WDL1]